jgi:hypothetical protein
VRQGTLLFLALASCSNGALRTDKTSLVVSYDGRTGHCAYKADGEEIAVRWGEGFQRVAEIGETWPGQQVTVVSSTGTPYRCIGGAIFELQRAGKDVGFISEPPLTH